MRNSAEIQALRNRFEKAVEQGQDAMLIQSILSGNPSPMVAATAIAAIMVLDCIKWVQGEDSKIVTEFMEGHMYEESGSHQCEVTAGTGEDSTPEWN